jgi:hypothetical protein
MITTPVADCLNVYDAELLEQASSQESNAIDTGNSAEASRGGAVLGRAADSNGPSIFWVTLKFHESGAEVTYEEKSALNKAVLIIVTRLYADVVAQGER